MNTKFSIKELEQLSGIKAHTIRIWEKRYELLKPDRSDTNIRTYSLEELKKLFSVNYLYNRAYKISKIAKLDSNEINTLVLEQVTLLSKKNEFLETFKLSMLNFDQKLFDQTFYNLLNDKSFDDVFETVFLELLELIGVLWHANMILPAHEHFISNLVRQKMLVRIEKLTLMNSINPEPQFVLFLPNNELHEIGLLYIHYYLIANKFHSVYIGQSVPFDNLKLFLKTNKQVEFVTHLTIHPTAEEFPQFIDDFTELLDSHPNSNLWISGRILETIGKFNFPSKIKHEVSINDLIKKINKIFGK